MKKYSLRYLALVSAISFVISGITHFAMPKEQIHFAHGIGPQFFYSLSENATAFHIHYWAFAVAALLAMSVFIYSIESFKNEFGIKVTGLWALLALALIAIDFTHMHANAMHIATQFANLQASVQKLILARGLDRLDSYGIGFTLIGIHVFYLNFLSAKNRDYALWIAWLGMAGGILLQFVLVGTLARSGIMIDLAAGLGGIVLFPIWLIGYGFSQSKISQR